MKGGENIKIKKLGLLILGILGGLAFVVFLPVVGLVYLGIVNLPIIGAFLAS